MSFVSLLHQTCSIYTTGYTETQIGERLEELTLLESGVACRINRKNGKEQILGDNSSVRIDAILYMEYRSDFEEWDFILVEGLYYKINSVYPVSDANDYHHLEIQLYIDKQL